MGAAASAEVEDDTSRLPPQAQNPRRRRHSFQEIEIQAPSSSSE